MLIRKIIKRTFAVIGSGILLIPLCVQAQDNACPAQAGVAADGDTFTTPYGRTVSVTTGMSAFSISPYYTVNNVAVHGMNRTVNFGMWRGQATGSSLTLTFDQPVPANQIILALFDLGSVVGSPAYYNPTVRLTITGPSATTQDFTATKAGSNNISNYNPATGIISDFDANYNPAEAVALVGQGTNLVDSLTLSISGGQSGDGIHFAFATPLSCVTLSKAVTDNDIPAGGFDFSSSNLTTVNGLPGALTPADTATPATSDVANVTDLTAPVLISETAVADWEMSDYRCIDNNGAVNGNGIGNLATKPNDLSVSLPDSVLTVDSDIVCTLTNSKSKAPTANGNISAIPISPWMALIGVFAAIYLVRRKSN